MIIVLTVVLVLMEGDVDDAEDVAGNVAECGD